MDTKLETGFTPKMKFSRTGRKSHIPTVNRLPRNSILCACLLSSLLLLCSEVIAEQKTEIVIIGTVHEETENFRIQDLVGILKRVKPDVILFELPAEMMTPSYEFKETLNSLEQGAVIEYVRISGANIRPYDIDGRNAFYQRTNYFERSRQCNDELDVQINKKKMSPEAQKIVDSLLAANARLNAIEMSDPMTINSFQADAAINERQWLVNQGIPEIVRLTQDLKGCETFWDLSSAEWIRRNNQMVANIKRYSVEFQGKRLVVICGLSHRYYLRSHLYDWRDKPPAYTLKEYWQY